MAQLTRLAWLPWLAVPAIVAWRLSGHRTGDLVVALVPAFVWIALAAWLAVRRAPGRFEALAAWDAAASRHEALASALSFSHEKDTADDPGRQLHLERATEAARGLAGTLGRDLPLPPPRWTWLGPVAAVALALWPVLRPELQAGDRPLTDDMLAAAAEEAAKLAQPDAQPDAVKELSAEEQKRLEELQKSVAELADKLKNAAGKTPRELLDELEAKARAAEELASQLGTGADTWASAEMLAEMRKHPDTADLADSVASKDAGRASKDARELSDQLKSPELTSEARERMARAVERTTAKATEQDLKKPTGKHVQAADAEFKQDATKQAGEEFEKLADEFARMEQREKAKEQLDQLAERLRQSGSSIMGQKGEAMKKMAGADGQSTSPMPGMESLAQMDPAQAGGEPLPVPGLGEQMKGMPQAGRGSFIPGTGKFDKNAKPMAVIPGTGKPDGPALAVAAPIPGTAPGAGPAVAIPGAGPPGNVPGGLLAGRGHIENGNESTKPTAAAAQGEVVASPGTEGDSFVQSIAGQPREEAAQRAAKKSAAEFLRTQEEAFDEKNLPPARREQLRRYFEAIRKTFDE